ncbi:MAG: hypothetical protein M0R33_07255 [Methylomonas sp.]|jgi:hypothetical protein|uniref:hypothetical protein n=1 Tax=Methylomonas sp. TaxID=418 RepID=UPI0025E89FC4|nr:hypothetical protein [Methylomonas sp.]MCK9606235.1 hypothetical protein [Methylomonas sp.]
MPVSTRWTRLVWQRHLRRLTRDGLPNQPAAAINNGLIRLHRSQSTLIEQLKFWPEADHDDDGPDALEMLWQIAKQFGGEFRYESAGQSRNKRRSTSRRTRDDEGWDDD